MNRLVNKTGFLVDLQGNVIDVFGNRMFDKAVLGADGNIPPVFRTKGLLSEHSTRSQEKLLQEIEKINDATTLANEQGVDEHAEHFAGDTSMDS